MQQQEEQVPETQKPRNRLFPGRITLEEIAESLGACERSARNLADRLRIPYIKVVNRRLYDADEVRAALLATEVNREPRGRGRPKRAA